MTSKQDPLKYASQPDAAGRFGRYGGKFVAETLMAALEELDTAWRDARVDPAFQSELEALLRNYVGRPFS